MYRKLDLPKNIFIVVDISTPRTAAQSSKQGMLTALWTFYKNETMKNSGCNGFLCYIHEYVNFFFDG